MQLTVIFEKFKTGLKFIYIFQFKNLKFPQTYLEYTLFALGIVHSLFIVCILCFRSYQTIKELMDKGNASMQKLFGNDIRRCFQNPGLNKFAKSAFSFLILVTFCTMLLEIMMPENIRNRLHKRHNFKMEKRWKKYMTKHSKILNELMKADVQLSIFKRKEFGKMGLN